MFPESSIHRLLIPPPRRDRARRRRNANAQPSRARRGRMPRLLGRLEALLDRLLAAGIAPGAEEIPHRVNVEHLLKRQCDVGSHHLVERQTKNGIPRHSSSSWNESGKRPHSAHKPDRSPGQPPCRRTTSALWHPLYIVKTALQPSIKNIGLIRQKMPVRREYSCHPLPRCPS